MKIELRDLDIKYISLVRAGANRRSIIAKDDQSLVIELPIAKSDVAKRIVYGIVYSPDEPDAHGDFASADEIEKAAYRFMAGARTVGSIDRDHSYKAGDNFVAESWIIRKGDPLFPGERAGAWAVGIKVVSDDDWAAIQKGEIQGLSMAGTAVRKVHKSDSAGQSADDQPAGEPDVGLLARILKSLKGGTTMEKSEIQALVAASVQDALAKSAAEQAAAGERERIAKALEKLDKIDEIAKTVETLKASVEKIEKATPGRSTGEQDKGGDGAGKSAGIL